MCHRQLRLWKATQCGHLTFSGETNIDCGSRDCFNSTAHPRTCSGSACRCRRYYTCVVPDLRASPPLFFPLTPRPTHVQPAGADYHARGTPTGLPASTYRCGAAPLTRQTQENTKCPRCK
ncbi:hypothetical protein BD413DRAFT_17152 [Trametes elegans]|nr:hypothetical protein BD413DRAFT_17152 [Trametes elegans]